MPAFFGVLRVYDFLCMPSSVCRGLKGSILPRQAPGFVAYFIATLAVIDPELEIQGYLAHKRTPTPLGPP